MSLLCLKKPKKSLIQAFLFEVGLAQNLSPLLPCSVESLIVLGSEWVRCFDFDFQSVYRTGRIKSGDEVIVPANTYIATILAISETGLVPVLVEPDEESFNLDPLL
jgi:hypothetical protein